MGENMDYELVDLIDIKELKKLTDNWTKLIGLPMGLFDPYGNALLGSGWLSVCTDFHRVNPITRERCHHSDLETFNQLKGGKEFCFLKCPNGLVDTGVAIIIEGRYLGGLGFGQFFLEPPDMAFFSRQADEFGFDKEKYLQAVTEVPILSLEHVEQISKIWRRLAKIIAETGLARLRLLELNRELERHKDHLEDLVKEKTAELAKAKETAEAANLAKSTFLANMSHELRTPLNAILGYGQLMSRDDGLPEKYKQNIGIISRSGEHLLGLIDEILEISKIESGSITLNKKGFNLHRIFDTTKEMFRISSEKKGLNLTVEHDLDLPEYIKTDEDKLLQILNNLIGNAIKYTNTGGIALRVKLKVASMEHSDVLAIEVTDTGIGIAPEHLDKVFEPFYQISDARHSPEGTGLGLALVQQYIHFMGGTISVKSKPGKGTTFTVELPFESVPESEIQTQPPVCRVIGLETGQPRYRILIVEDNPDSRSFLRQMLEQVGFSVKEAVNGQEAVNMYESWKPHLILMDIRMPVMDGLEATRHILERELTAHSSQPIEDDSSELSARSEPTTIIALTASVFEDAREKVLAAGCDDFLRKPFQEAEMFKLIEKHLGVRYTYLDQPGPETLTDLTRDDNILTSAEFKKLPEGWFDNMCHAAMCGRSRRVLELIQEVQEDHARLAEVLTDLTRNFQVEKIPTLLEKAYADNPDREKHDE